MNFDQTDLFASCSAAASEEVAPAPVGRSLKRKSLPVNKAQLSRTKLSRSPAALSPTPEQTQTQKYSNRLLGLTNFSNKVIQPDLSPSTSPLAQWGNCRVCGSPIAIPGNDADLCSNPARTCGSSGWVDNPKWGSAYYETVRQQQTQRGGKKS